MSGLDTQLEAIEQAQPEEEIDFVELEPGEVPKHWRNIPFRVLQHALTFGLVIPGYTCKNYIEHAIETKGYETIELWGIQGSGKSNRLLCHGYWVYGDWDKVLANIMFKMEGEDRGFIQALKNIPFGQRKPWLGIDDVTVHYTSSTWKTDIRKYEAVDAAWAAIRTKVNVISLSSPLIDRLAKNIKDNVTLEVFIGRNQVELVERFVRLPGLNQVESNFFKLQVEPLHKFNIYDVPTDVFREYWDLRLTLADEAIGKLGAAYGEEDDLDGYIALPTIVSDLELSPNTVIHLASKGAIRAKKVGRLMYVFKEDYDKVLVPYYSKQIKRRRGEKGR